MINRKRTVKIFTKDETITIEDVRYIEFGKTFVKVRTDNACHSVANRYVYKVVEADKQ